MSQLKLELAEGWAEVAPRSDAPEFVAEVDGRLVHLGSDFSCRRDFGPVGPVECPLAIDQLNLRVFRYVSKAGFGSGQDYSHIRAFDLRTGKSFPVIELPLNQWVLWMLEWIGGSEGKVGQLIGLVASDRTNARGVTIEHQLFALTPGEPAIRRRPLCRDAYRPLAFSRRRRELVFSGAEGTYLLGLNGERKQSLFKGRCTTAEGASFDPLGAARVVLAGGGIHIWDTESGRCNQLAAKGRHPVWSSDGHRIYFRESSSDLHYIDLSNGERTCLLSVAGQQARELWFAQPICFSPCSRYAAAPVSSRRLRGVQQNASSGGERERVYRYAHATVIMDFEKCELWLCEGMASRIEWLGGARKKVPASAVC
ncbi:MAG: hypothetical protein AAF065_01970 [Verrucomicrobiota bacterium]